MNLQMFSNQQKISFLGAFEWFFGHNSPKFGQIALKYSPVI